MHAPKSFWIAWENKQLQPWNFGAGAIYSNNISNSWFFLLLLMWLTCYCIVIMGNSTVILRSVNCFQSMIASQQTASSALQTPSRSQGLLPCLFGAWYLLVAWWSLSFKFTWFFRSKEIKFIKGNSMEDSMCFWNWFFFFFPESPAEIPTITV